MFAGLAIDGTAVTSLDEDSTVELILATDIEFRCSVCGADLVETPRGFDDDNGDNTCPAYQAEASDGDANGPHMPQRVALSWCNSAGIRTDEADDAITLSLSTGDPRGAFTLTIRRIPDDADSPFAGRLVMHMPHPDAPMLHEPLHPLHPGTFAIGHPVPAARAHLTAA